MIDKNMIPTTLLELAQWDCDKHAPIKGYIIYASEGYHSIPQTT